MRVLLGCPGLILEGRTLAEAEIPLLWLRREWRVCWGSSWVSWAAGLMIQQPCLQTGS